MFVSVIPVTVTFGIDNVPVNACGFVSNELMPEPAVKVPLFVMPPRNVTAELPELFQVADEETVTRPANVFAPVPDAITRFAADADPTFVAPFTVKGNPPTVNVDVLPTVSAPDMVVDIPVLVDDELEVVKSLNVVPVVPPIDCVAPLKLITLPADVNAPPLFTQFPASWCVKAPPMNVPPLKVRLPPIVMPATAVALAVPPIVKLPVMLVVPACNVFAPLPVKLRLTYEFECIVCAAPEYVTVLPAAVAVNVVIPDVLPRSNVAFAACVNVPVPDKALRTDRLLLFVKLMPVTVTFGIVNVPVNACGFVSKK